jgi:hypothetical protein
MRLIKDPNSDNPYLRFGHPSRRAYLRQLAQDFGVPLGKVTTLAEILGEQEDFDGLVSMLDDLSMQYM